MSRPDTKLQCAAIRHLNKGFYVVVNPEGGGVVALYTDANKTRHIRDFGDWDEVFNYVDFDKRMFGGKL